MQPGVPVKRGPGRPKKRVAPPVVLGTGGAPRKKLVGRVRRWTKKLVSDGHLDLVRWVVVEGSERNRKFVDDEEALAAAAAAAAAAESDSEEHEAIGRRTRVQRAKSMADLGDPFGGGLYQQQLMPAQQPVLAVPVVNLVRYRCPVSGCGQVFFKVAGLLAHTRMKHKMRKEKVNVQGCKFIIDPGAPAEESGGMGGGGGMGMGRGGVGGMGAMGSVGADEDEDDEAEAPPQQQEQARVNVSLPSEEPQAKKIKLVFKMPKRE